MLNLKRRVADFTRQFAKIKRSILRPDEVLELQRLVGRPQPASAGLAVCFFAPAPYRFSGKGKVSAPAFLPVFCDRLRELGIRTHFARTHADLKKALGDAQRSVVVCIYREEGFTPSDPALIKILDNADIVFNHPRSGAVIANKTLASKALSAVGCPVPRAATTLGSEAIIFSNEVNNSGAHAFTTTQDQVDDTRHNTEFVDTRREYEGVEYFTTIRLMCINNRIVHQCIRVRPSSERNPSVHAKDTPRNARMINALHREARLAAGDQLQDIADRVHQAFGPGFYSHDTLIDSRNGRTVICETGYKFNDMTYQTHLRDIAGEIEGLSGFETPTKAALSSAPIFADELFRAFGGQGILPDRVTMP